MNTRGGRRSNLNTKSTKTAREREALRQAHWRGEHETTPHVGCSACWSAGRFPRPQS